MPKNPNQKTLDRKVWEAAADCNVPKLARLLAAGGNPNAKYRSFPALSIAIGQGNIRETRYEGDDVIVIQHNPMETVQLLLDAGADANKPSFDGHIPIMDACYSTELLALLLPRTQNINAQSRSGFTAMMLAAVNGSEESARALINAGADLNLVAKDGQTAWDKASYHPKVQKMIEKAGGKSASQTAVGVEIINAKNAASRRTVTIVHKLHKKWKLPDFSRTVTSLPFQRSVAQLQSLCGNRAPIIDQTRPALITFKLSRAQVTQLIEEFFDEFLENRAYLFGSGGAIEETDEDSISVLPTTSAFDVILYMGTNRNDGVGAPAVCEGLTKLQNIANFKITRVNFDTLEGRWSNVTDAKLLARRLEKFCPDIVHQGGGSVSALAKHLAKDDRLFLWWD